MEGRGWEWRWRLGGRVRVRVGLKGGAMEGERGCWEAEGRRNVDGNGECWHKPQLRFCPFGFFFFAGVEICLVIITFFFFFFW